MKLAWSAADLRQVCVSKHGLDLAAPAETGDVKVLLSLIAGAEDIAQIERLNCVAVERAGASVVLRLGAVEIEAMVVHPTAGPQQQIPQLHVRAGLMIQQIRVAGQPLLRAAG